MKKRQTGKIIEQCAIAPGIYDLRLEAPEVAAEAQAGQFVNLFVPDAAHILPRPISLAGIDREKGRIRLVYRVGGAGTQRFAAMQPGEPLSLLGPLGNGFPLEKANGRAVLLLGGGIGIPPLLQTAHALQQKKEQDPADAPRTVTAVLGYRDGTLFLKDEFSICDAVGIATEDGSCGTQGTVLDVLRKQEPEKDALLFACGPTPMLRAVQTYAKKQGLEAWLSLEERMACGVGACLACVCKTAAVDAHSQVKNRRVCKDGPVFAAEEIQI